MNEVDTLNVRLRKSERDMERKVEAAGCCVKLQDIDFGCVIEDKKEIVKRVIGILKSEIHPEDRYKFDRILRKTRIVVLGKRTQSVRDRGENIFTVPILLEASCARDSEEIGEMLRRGGFFPSFHWPSEIMPFIGDIREEVRSTLGYGEDHYYVRIRPETRGGEIQLRADVKHRDGGRWMSKAYWFCPPLDRDLWEAVDGLYDPKLVNTNTRG